MCGRENIFKENIYLLGFFLFVFASKETHTKAASKPAQYKK